MKVGEYYIGWHYSWMMENNRRKMVTRCTLYKDKEVVHHVHVHNHHHDTPSKKLGQKAGLSKLLDQLKMIMPGIFHRRFRAEIWETYRTLTKEPRWKLKQFKRNYSTSPSDSATQERSTQATPSPTPTGGSPS